MSSKLGSMAVASVAKARRKMVVGIMAASREGHLQVEVGQGCMAVQEILVYKMLMSGE